MYTIAGMTAIFKIGQLSFLQVEDLIDRLLLYSELCYSSWNPKNIDLGIFWVAALSLALNMYNLPKGYKYSVKQ